MTRTEKGRKTDHLMVIEGRAAKESLIEYISRTHLDD